MQIGGSTVKISLRNNQVYVTHFVGWIVLWVIRILIFINNGV